MLTQWPAAMEEEPEGSKLLGKYHVGEAVEHISATKRDEGFCILSSSLDALTLWYWSGKGIKHNVPVDNQVAQ
jgi:hypothetical protein